MTEESRSSAKDVQPPNDMSSTTHANGAKPGTTSQVPSSPAPSWTPAKRRQLFVGRLKGAQAKMNEGKSHLHPMPRMRTFPCRYCLEKLLLFPTLDSDGPRWGTSSVLREGQYFIDGFCATSPNQSHRPDYSEVRYELDEILYGKNG